VILAQPIEKILQTKKELAAAMLFAAICVAPVAAHAAPSPLGSVVAAATQGAVIVDKTAGGPSKDLTAIIGHLKSDPAHRVVLWLVDGKYVLAGSLFDASGADLSKQTAIQEGLIPKPMTGAQAFAIAKPAHAILVGKSGPEITAFEDPDCSACHAMNQDIAKAIDAGKLRVRVIPVGFLKPDSIARASAILSAKEPAAAWRANEAEFNVQAEMGGYPIGHPAPSAMAHVQSNTQLLSRVNQGQIATPTLLYCDKAGEPQMMRGWQDSLLSKLGAAGCMPH
jgi:thiol:disulfide interchange protein DsbG